MAVENLYNTAVEYHSSLAAEPPPHLRPAGQTHLTVSPSSWRTTRAFHMENPGCFVVFVTDLVSCLLLCGMLPLLSSSLQRGLWPCSTDVKHKYVLASVILSEDAANAQRHNRFFEIVIFL